MLTLGWFSTGRGEGSLGLLRLAQEAIERGELQAKIGFVFSNREPGEAEGSDRFFRQVREYGIPLITCSSTRFRRERGGGPIARHRLEFDREAMRLLEGFEPDLCVLAGYGLITDVEMCRRYTMLNLHPALPDGPTGTYQLVIWKLIEQHAEESGAFVHLATEELDRGPALTYCSFSLRGDAFDAMWREVEGRSMEDLMALEGEDLSLFRLIRQEGVRREQPLLLETVKAFAAGYIRVEGRRPLDGQGRPLSEPLSLNEAVGRALAGRGLGRISRGAYQMRIIDLQPGEGETIRQAAALLVELFREDHPDAWPDMASALEEVEESLGEGRISRVAVDEAGAVLGWIGGVPRYRGRVWELHPLAVHAEHQGMGIGRALVADLEARVRERGGVTLWLGTDDESNQTTLAAVDLYPDPLSHLARIQNLRRHPYEFYLKVGFVIVGVVPDANGWGRPDILMAKRVGRG